MPNQLQAAHDKELLLDKFVALMRALGHFPGYRELQFKQRSDPGFPDSTTFARFGSKVELAATVRDYCKDRAGYDDIVMFCATVVGRPSDASKGDDEIEETFGYVYLIKAGQYYKIGRSNAVGRRAYELAIQLPEKAITVHSIRTDDPAGIEHYWHRRFKTKHKNGEWYVLSSPDVRAFKRRKFM